MREKLPHQRRRPDYLLEVVEHEQEFFVAQMILEGFRERVVRRSPWEKRGPARAEATSSGSLMGASATKKTPPSNSSNRSAARGKLKPSCPSLPAR